MKGHDAISRLEDKERELEKAESKIKKLKTEVMQSVMTSQRAFAVSRSFRLRKQAILMKKRKKHCMTSKEREMKQRKKLMKRERR